MRLILFLVFLILFSVSPLWGEEARKAIEVFPSTPYYRFIVYENLALLWIAIGGLIVIIRMKLREIERLHKLGMDRDAEDERR